MNNIDKEIEDFKNNLLTIDKLSKDLNNNNDKLEKVLKETTELDNVKKGLQSEVDNLKKSNEGYIEKVEKSSNEISQTCEQINISVESIQSDTSKALDKLNTFGKKIDDLSVEHNNILNKLKYSMIANAILLILIIIILIIK